MELSAVVCIVGLIIYLLVSGVVFNRSGAVAEVGRIMFFAGLLVWLMHHTGKVLG